MPLDAQGYIVAEADLANVPPAYLGVPEAAAAALTEGFGDRLHGGYLYGSVVRGNAVPGRSDLDVLAVLRTPATGADRAAAARVGADLCERFPVLADAGVGLTHLAEVCADRHGLQVFLREMSVCVCGADLRPRLPAARPGPEIAAGFHRDTPEVLARCRTVLAGGADQAAVRRACRVAARRMVQAAFAVVMARDRIWSTVLEEQAAAVGAAFPRWDGAVRLAAAQGRQPVPDPAAVADLLATFGRWVEGRLEPLLEHAGG